MNRKTNKFLPSPFIPLKIFIRVVPCPDFGYHRFSMNAVSVKNVSFSYENAKKPAVDNLSFDLEEKSYTVLAGVNGSGKSTVSRIIAGLLEPASGSVSVRDGFRVGIVFQSPKDQIICSVVERDTAFGPKNQGLSKTEVESVSRASLSAVGLLSYVSRRSMSLSLGQTQKLALAGIIGMNPDVLILDETLSMLDPFSRREIFDFLDDFHKKGKTILHVSHESEAVFRAEKIIMMEKGRLLWHGSRNDFLKGDGFLHYRKVFALDFEINKFRVEKIAENGENIGRFIRNEKKLPSAKEISLTAENIVFSYTDSDSPVLDGISFSLKKGTLISLTGASGSGKTTLLEILSGLRSCTSESSAIYALGRPALAQQNSDAALFETFAVDDVAFGPANRGKKGKLLVSAVKSAMEKVSLPFDDFASRQTFTLSGGEKRRLSLAGIIAMDADVFLFDEPTAGLDGEARSKILLLMRNLCDEGKTVLFSTHHADEADFADEHFHLEGGKIVEILENFSGEKNHAELNANDFPVGAEDSSYNGTEKKHSENEKSGVQKTSSVDSAENVRKKRESQNLLLERQFPLEGVKILKNLQDFSEIGLSGSSSLASAKKIAPLKKIPPAAKYLLFIGIFVSALVVKPLWLCGLFAFLSFVYALFSGCLLRRLFSAMVKVVPLLLFFFLVEFMFAPVPAGETPFVDYAFFSVSMGKIFFCIKTLLHTEAALCSIMAFVASADENDIIDGLESLLFPLKVIGVPVRYPVILMEIIFRFVPLLLEEAICIIKTQLVRGAFGKAKGFVKKIRAVVPLFVPLVIRTIKRAEILADALTARGFK